MGASAIKANGADRDLFNIGAGLPFARKGSWFGVYADNSSMMIYGRRLYIGSRRGSTAVKGGNTIVNFSPIYNGEKIDYGVRTTATELILRTVYGEIRFCFADPKMMYIKGENGLGIRFETAMQTHEMMKKRGIGWEQVTGMLGSMVYVPLKGKMDVDAKWDYETLSTPNMRADMLPDENGEFLVSFEESTYGGTIRDSYPSYAEALADVAADWEEFKSYYPPVSEEYAEIAQLAMYIQWSFIINPEGRMKRPLIQMLGRAFASSWQMTENAVAMMNNIPIRNQLLMNMIDLQGPLGQFPDFYDDTRSNVQGIKPPIQGWGLKWIMRSHDLKSEFSKEDLTYLYEGFKKWADWFMKYRDDDKDGIPEYDNGDESGIDDSTIFAYHPEIESPDLIADLVLLYEALGDVAKMLERNEEAEADYAQSKKLLDTMIKELWNGETFIARDARTHETIVTGTVLHVWPLVLGHRLPQEIIEKLTAKVMDENGLLTPFGLASEDPEHPLFRVSGFGRGFVLPAPQMLVITGLYDAGKVDEAKLIARRYCDAMRTNNFNMLTNPIKAGISAFSSSWAVCAFFVLANMIENM